MNKQIVAINVIVDIIIVAIYVVYLIRLKNMVEARVAVNNIIDRHF